MFCNQCEQASKGTGCTQLGVCGKEPEVHALQELLIHELKSLSNHTLAARAAGITNKEVDGHTLEALFSTLTNVNFDNDRFVGLIAKTAALRGNLAGKLKAAGNEPLKASSIAASADSTLDELNSLAAKLEAAALIENVDIKSLQDILLYGLKGLSAYAVHAKTLGQEDDAVYAFMHEGLASLLNADLGLDELVGLAIKCGEVNIRAMELLDAGNTGTYGHPVPTQVPLGAKAGKAILISGHDLKDLDLLLQQTVGKGINIYSHGEMLPTHGYPQLKKYDHFYGHYGTAWQNQNVEFAAFPGAIIMTTNCIQKPIDSYKDNIFTCGAVGWPGVSHVENHDFSSVIEKAQSLPGFSEDTDKGAVTVGYARNAVLGVADKIIDAVKAGAIKHFFLVAGCDGAKPGRNYYTELVEKAPADTVIMTLACGKFRFFDKDLGDIGGIPRLLDIGQCNDAFSAIQIALALADAFGVGVNELPLSFILSWYEQKAVVILLSLFSLGIKNIRLGPTLPAFITPAVLDVLVQKYDIKPITTADEDLKAILGDTGSDESEMAAS